MKRCLSCCSLRCEHITIKEDHQIELDFLGKDSIRYHNTVTLKPKVHANIERFLDGKGLHLMRTGVGDRYVVEAMRKGGFNLGGEQSGHIVMTDYATTGDGLLAGLQFLAAMMETGKRASELTCSFETVPQLLQNVRYTNGSDPLSAEAVLAAIGSAETELLGQGRLLIRKSGTEPLVRVMVEAEDDTLMRRLVDSIVTEVEAAV